MDTAGYVDTASFSITLYLLPETGSFTVSLVLTLQMGVTTPSNIYVGSGDPSSSPHICKATLTHEGVSPPTSGSMPSQGEHL